MDKLKMAFPFAHQIAIAIGIVIVWIIVNKVVSLTTSRGFDLLHKRLVKNGKNGSRPAALQRIETLKGITLNVVKWLIAVIFVLSLIGSFGVNITPILTGVGLAGLGR